MSENLTESWNEYRRLVIDTLEKLKESIEETSCKVNELNSYINTNKVEVIKLLMYETEKLNTDLKTLVDKHRDEGREDLHKLDIRVNTLETKIYTYTAVISGGVGVIISLGKTIIEAWLK